jgi:hypothetical protein
MDYKKKTPPSTNQTLRNPAQNSANSASKKSAPPGTNQTLQTLLQKKRSTRYESNPAKRCAEPCKPCVKKNAPPSTNQTLRNPAQNSANPASKKTLHPVQLQLCFQNRVMPGSYYNRLRKSLIQWWLMDDSITP